MGGGQGGGGGRGGPRGPGRPGDGQAIPDPRQEPRLDAATREQLSRQVGDLMRGGYT